MTHSNTTTVRVLVVEDNEVDARLVKFALQGVASWRVSFDLVGDGEQAIDYLKAEGNFKDKEHPDLVVLDLNLPKRDGAEVLRTIRHDPELKSVKVIVLSSSPTDVIQERVKDVQPDCFFTKPLGLDEFIALGENMHRCYVDSGARSLRSAGS